MGITMMAYQAGVGAPGSGIRRLAGLVAVMMITSNAASGGNGMELAHEFTVNTPVDRAWAVLTDIERIAPCMPGAELTEVDGDTYHGLVKVKVGPISAQYKGTASFVEKDEAAHRVVLKAAGRDARGQGNASATVTAVMAEQGDGTRVAIVTDMTVSGRVAQFGRGVMADITAKLLQQFVDNLEADVLAPAAGSTPGSGAASAPGSTPMPGATSAPGGTPGPGATSAPAQAIARAAEPVRPMRMILGSVFSRAGHAIARWFRRLTGRRQD
jgi:carbon monoxide dehydrogenase subunit G